MHDAFILFSLLLVGRILVPQSNQMISASTHDSFDQLSSVERESSTYIISTETLTACSVRDVLVVMSEGRKRGREVNAPRRQASFPTRHCTCSQTRHTTDRAHSPRCLSLFRRSMLPVTSPAATARSPLWIWQRGTSPRWRTVLLAKEAQVEAEVGAEVEVGVEVEVVLRLRRRRRRR